MQAFITPMPGWAEILVLLGIGVLIFGRRLPEVGRNIGRGIVEFKKGLRGIEDDVDHGSHTTEPGQIEDSVDQAVQDSEPKQVEHDPRTPRTIDPADESQVRRQQPS